MYVPLNAVVHKVPQQLTPRVATLAVPFGNGFQWAVLDGGAGPGRTVLVFGPGQQGLGCVFASKCAGAVTVIVAGQSRDRARLDLALAHRRRRGRGCGVEGPESRRNGRDRR